MGLAVQNDRTRSLVVVLLVVAGILLLGPYFGLRIFGREPARSNSEIEGAPIDDRPDDLEKFLGSSRPRQPNHADKSDLSEIEELLR